MRPTLLWFGLAVLGFFGIAAGQQADKKSTEEERKVQEEEVAFLDRIFENSAWAVKAREIIADLNTDLSKAERVEVMRLNPTPLAEAARQGKNTLHGYQIVASAKVETPATRREITGFVGKALHWNRHTMGDCFNPRHGMRIVSGMRTIEFVLCLECHGVDVYVDRTRRAVFDLRSPKENPLERFLRDAENKASPQRGIDP